MQASQLGVGGMNRGIKGIWKRKGLSSGLNIHPELQADVDSKLGCSDSFVVVADGA